MVHDPEIVRIHRTLIRLLSDDALTATKADAFWLLEVATAEAADWPAEVTAASCQLHRSYIAAVDQELAWRRHHGLSRTTMTFGFPPEFLAELKARIRIEDEISLVTELHPYGGALRGRCPIHNGVSNTSLVVWPSTQRWRCWGGCGGGDILDWVRVFNPQLREFRQAVSYAAARAGVDLPRPARPTVLRAREVRSA